MNLCAIVLVLVSDSVVESSAAVASINLTERSLPHHKKPLQTMITLRFGISIISEIYIEGIRAPNLRSDEI